MSGLYINISFFYKIMWNILTKETDISWFTITNPYFANQQTYHIIGKKKKKNLILAKEKEKK